MTSTAAEPVKPALLLAADTPVAMSPDGPFLPLGHAIVRNDALRAILAAELEVPSVVRFRTVKSLAPALVAPLAWLIYADAVAQDIDPRMRFIAIALDVLGIVAVLHDGTRRAPFRRWIVAAAVLGANARIADGLASACTMQAFPIALVATSTALLVFWLSRVQASRIVAREVLDALDISVDAVLALPDDPGPSTPLVVFTFAGALGVVVLARLIGALPVSVYIALLTAWGLFFPAVGERVFGRAAAAFEAGAFQRRELATAALVGVAGFVGASFFAHAAHHGFDAGAHMLRCRDAVSFESSGAKRQLLLETVEATQLRARMRDTVSAMLLFGLVLPVATERIFRGLMQRVLSRRFTVTTGLFGSAFLFALAESATYESLFYQTLAIGIAFGATYAEGGLLAALIAHVLYSSHLLL